MGVPVGITLVAALAAWWLSRRRYRIPEDTVHRTLPAWLLPVLAAVGALVAAPFYLGQPPVVIITYGAALVWGLVLAFIDLDVRRLPDWLTLPAYPVAACCSPCARPPPATEPCSGRPPAPGSPWSCSCWPRCCRRGPGLGLGDVKLAGTLGGLLGWWGWWTALYGLLTGFILGGLVAAVLLVSRAGRPQVAPVLRPGTDRRRLHLGRAAAALTRPAEGPERLGPGTQPGLDDLILDPQVCLG